MHDRNQLAAGKVRIHNLAGWEELMTNETAAAPPNSEHDSLLETTGFLAATSLDLASPTPSVCSGSLQNIHLSSHVTTTLRRDFVSFGFHVVPHLLFSQTTPPPH